jgi:hypothetical protein
MSFIQSANTDKILKPPILPIEHQSFSTPFPSNLSDHEAWGAFLDAQQLILKCTQYTVALKKALSNESDMTNVQDMMFDLDQEANLVNFKYNWDLECPQTLLVDSSERILAHSLKAQAKIKMNSARIKLHRYFAFQDAPIFTKRHCDLKQASYSSAPSCCSTERHISSPTSNGAVNLQLSSPPATEIYNQSSAKICMGAALAIGRAFESRPCPNPMLTALGSQVTFLSDTSQVQAPRTMPVFACCAMQSSYALLMLCYRAKELNSRTSTNSALRSGLNELYSGLQRVLNALQNYSIAYEAIGGMRGMLRSIVYLLIC